jgi:hypothetical protein
MHSSDIKGILIWSPSFILQTKLTSDQSDDKIALAHARYTFKPGNEIAK